MTWLDFNLLIYPLTSEASIKVMQDIIKPLVAPPEENKPPKEEEEKEEEENKLSKGKFCTHDSCNRKRWGGLGFCYTHAIRLKQS